MTAFREWTGHMEKDLCHLFAVPAKEEDRYIGRSQGFKTISVEANDDECFGLSRLMLLGALAWQVLAK